MLDVRLTGMTSKKLSEQGVPVAPEHDHEVVKSQRPDLVHPGLTLPNWTTVLDRGRQNVHAPELIRRYRSWVFHVVTRTTKGRRLIVVRPDEQENDAKTII